MKSYLRWRCLASVSRLEHRPHQLAPGSSLGPSSTAPLLRPLASALPCTLGRTPQGEWQAQCSGPVCHVYFKPLPCLGICSVANVLRKPPGCTHTQEPCELPESPGTAPHPGSGALDPTSLSKTESAPISEECSLPPTHTEALAQMPEV